MGAHQTKVLKLTFDPGVLYLAQVAEEQEATIKGVIDRLESAEKKIAECCDGEGIKPAFATEEKTEALGRSLEEKTVAIGKRIDILDGKVAVLATSAEKSAAPSGDKASTPP